MPNICFKRKCVFLLNARSLTEDSFTVSLMLYTSGGEYEEFTPKDIIHCNVNMYM